MKTKAAILWGVDEPWKIEELDLDPPKNDEVLVKIAASGLCHSDLHVQRGDLPVEFPYLTGHEGAGIVVEVGPNVVGISPGDHVVFSFMPACGHCRWCATGHQNLCDLGAAVMAGPQLDGSYRFHTSDGTGVGQLCLLGTFSEYVVAPTSSVVVIAPHLPLDKAALVGCGVTTGWGSAVNAAGVSPADFVVVLGGGGIGMSAVQGARLAGAQDILLIDPVQSKRDAAATFGATLVAANTDEAWEMIADRTAGVMADSAVICVGLADGEIVGEAFRLVRKAGTVVLTAISGVDSAQLNIPGFEMTLYEKTVKGSLFGSANPHADIPRLLGLYEHGLLKLDEMITKTYSLEDVNEGYADMEAGRNVRGVILFD